MATFNSREYAWSDVSIAIDGTLIQATGFKVTTQREMELLYGRGSDPYGVQYAGTNCEGEISLWQSELEKLIAKAPNKDLTLMQFNVVVSYGSSDNLTTDTWKSFCPTEVTKEFNQGDFRMEVTIPGIILGVEYNTK